MEEKLLAFLGKSSVVFREIFSQDTIPDLSPFYEIRQAEMRE